jgi:iduronate 2-sulfatase
VSPSQKGFLLREDRWAFIQYEEDGSGGTELFDMRQDPKQTTNLSGSAEYKSLVKQLQDKLAAKLRQVRSNDLSR